MARSSVRIAAGVIAVMLGCGVAGAVGYTGGSAARPDAKQLPTPTASGPLPSSLAGAAAVVTPSAVTEAPAPSAAGVSAALVGPMADGALGSRVVGQVLDASTGAVLYDRDAGTPVAPASTAKLSTALALMDLLPPDATVQTTVTTGSAPGEIVLVGAGDPTLSSAAPGQPTQFAGAARLSDLAAAIKANPASATVPITRIVVDSSVFAGSTMAPGWVAADMGTSYAGPITGLMIDAGRAASGDVLRSLNPDIAAGRQLANLLGVPGAVVVAGSRPAGATVLASVKSARLVDLVEQMVASSDNVIADVLSRWAAVAAKQEPSFAGAVIAVSGVLARFNLADKFALSDASGLSSLDTVQASGLTALLRIALTGTGAAADRELSGVISGLPVAGWSGTLFDRYLAGSGSEQAAGIVRAKTGTLSGVSALAGTVRDADGRLLVFAVLAEAVPEGGTDPAEAALDRAAATLAACGCR